MPIPKTENDSLDQYLNTREIEDRGNLTKQGFLVSFPSFPTASKDHRGRVAVKYNGAGVADETKVCWKKADDTYEWFNIPGHTHTGAAGDGPKLIAADSIEFTAPPTLKASYQETGFCGQQGDSPNAGTTLAQGVNFKTKMTNIPSSITLTVQTSGNFDTLQAWGMNLYGFVLSFKRTVAGSAYWFGTYTTVGN